MSRKLTKWLNVDPKYPGVYQRLFSFGDYTRMFYSNWNGRFWGQSGITQYEAYMRKNQSSYRQRVPWRGLAKKP